jgi:hypothetical protein
VRQIQLPLLPPADVTDGPAHAHLRHHVVQLPAHNTRLINAKKWAFKGTLSRETA